MIFCFSPRHWSSFFITHVVYLPLEQISHSWQKVQLHCLSIQITISCSTGSGILPNWSRKNGAKDPEGLDRNRRELTHHCRWCNPNNWTLKMKSRNWRDSSAGWDCWECARILNSTHQQTKIQYLFVPVLPTAILPILNRMREPISCFYSSNSKV